MPGTGVPACRQGITASTSHPHHCSGWGWAEIFQTPWVRPSPSLPHCLFLGHYVRQGEFVSVQSRPPDSLKPLRIYHPELLFVGLQDPLPHSQAQMLLCLLHGAWLPPGSADPSLPPWMPRRAGFPARTCLQRLLLGAGCCGHSGRGRVLPTGKVLAVASSGFAPRGCQGRWPRAGHAGLPAQKSPGNLR